MLRKLIKGGGRWIGRLLATPEERRHAKVGPAHLWKLKRDFQIDFLKREGLRAEHTLLDVGCGTLRGGVPVIEYLEPGHYWGVEVRQDVLAEGIKELHEAGLEDKTPTLVCVEDLGQLDLGRRFDFIWSFSVLIHMSDDVLESCLKMVALHLADDGFFYANVNIGSSTERRWQGFPIVWRSINFYEAMARRHGLLLEQFGTLQSLGHVTSSKQDSQVMLRMRRGAPIA